MNKRRAERECQQQNETDSGQSAVGDRVALTLLGAGLWAVPASVQEAMLEGPVLSQIIPAVVFLFQRSWPSRRTRLAGKAWGSKVVIENHSWSVVSG
jgi:hypothetical protein